MMNIGYTLEVMKEDTRAGHEGLFYGSDCFHYSTETEARKDMRERFPDKFCILTEWGQDGGFGDYEIEIERQNW